eukprot:scaffold8474_cov134-Isochrysis_galbana.AAC.3
MAATMAGAPFNTYLLTTLVVAPCSTQTWRSTRRPWGVSSGKAAWYRRAALCTGTGWSRCASTSWALRSACS